MAVLSELGLDPISIDALRLATGFWYHVIPLMKVWFTKHMKRI
jgi:hypothetical protein